MKKLLLVLSSVMAVTLTTLAQMPGGMPGGKMAAPPSIGHIYGKLVDSSGRPIDGATVVVMRNKYDSATKKNKEVLFKGLTTKANGEFNFEDLPLFGLKLKVSALGFKPYEAPIAFSMPKMSGGAAPSSNGQMPDFAAMTAGFDKDLGNIALKTDAHELQDVVVKANTKGLKMDIDKKVFNVESNLVSAGGTAVDVMKNVPSLNVDIDGNVTLRNASPQIYIDGRPTTLSLDQIPADAIESVEVITNPSAKYDASGGNAGILNIVLKKNKKSGYNGNVNLGVDKRGGLNGGASINVRQNKLNLSLASFTNQMRNRNTANTDIRSLLTNPNTLVEQDSKERMKGGFIFGRFGADYFVTNRLTLSAGVVRVHGEFNPNTILNTDSTFEGGPYISHATRTTTNKREFNALGLTGGFKLIFPTQGEELTADFNSFNGKNSNNAFYNTDVFATEGGVKTGNRQQKIQGSGNNKFATIQMDYVKPFKGSAKLETGVRAQLRNMSNNQGNYVYDASSGLFVLIPSATNNYKNKDNVYAAYLSFANSIKSFGYKVGLRAESSDYVGELIDTKQTFENKYPISLFPSVFLSQKLKDNQEIQMSVTRRVNRPFFMQIIPFIDSTDQLNWSRGNAALKPEFTNSLEFSYSKQLKKNNSILVSLYYKHSTNLITRYLDTISVVAGGEKHPVSTYVNANSSRSMGAEFTSQNQVTKWWDANTNINLYNSKINTDNLKGTSQDALWSWFAKTNNNFKLPANFKLQVSATYQSKTNMPVNQNQGFMGGPPPPGGGAQSASQGYIKAFWGMDLALQKSFLKNNAGSVTLSVNDVFRTRRFTQYSLSDYFIQNSSRLSDAPMFRLTFSFRFGKMDMSILKRKNMKGEMEGSQGAMQGMN